MLHFFYLANIFLARAALQCKSCYVSLGEEQQQAIRKCARLQIWTHSNTPPRSRQSRLSVYATEISLHFLATRLERWASIQDFYRTLLILITIPSIRPRLSFTKLPICWSKLKKLTRRGFSEHTRGVRVYKAHLRGCPVYGAHLRGCPVYGAHLRGCPVYGAHLRGCPVYAALCSRGTQQSRLRQPETEKRLLSVDWTALIKRSEVRQEKIKNGKIVDTTKYTRNTDKGAK